MSAGFCWSYQRHMFGSALPLRLSEPPWNRGFVLEIGLTELRLKCGLLMARDNIHPHAQHHKADQDGGAPEKNRPAEPQRRFSDVHWVARERVGTTHQ